MRASPSFSAAVLTALLSVVAAGCAAAAEDPAPGGSTAAPAGSGAPTNLGDDAAPPEADAGAPSEADAAPTPPAYPAAPFGKTKGKVFPDLAIEGYRDGTGDWTPIAMSDYYDPDGARGVRAVYVLIVAQWCSVCMQEAAQLPKEYAAKWKGRGAKFVMALAQDRSGKSPSKTTVDQWKSSFPAINFDLVVDPTSSFLPPASTGFPTCLLIDPKTMKVLEVMPGVTSDGSIPGLDELLTRNGG